MNQRLAVPQPEPSALKRLRLAVSAHCPLSVPWGLIFIILFAGLLPATTEARRLPARRAIDECRGNIVPLFEQYNARLDRLCDECYEIYRDQTIRDQCSKDCYRNEVFRDCLQALMIKQEIGDVYKMINTLAG